MKRAGGTVALLLALFTASCGGDADPTTTTAPVTTTTAATATAAETTTTTEAAIAYPYDFAVHPEAPVIEPEEWDQSYTAVPWVMIEGGEWLLFYAGASGRSASLGLATSPEGVAFERHPDNPLFTPDEGGLGWFSIAEFGGEWVMWYVSGFTPPYRRVNRATAPDLDGPWTDEGEAFIAPDREWDQFIVPTGVTEIDGTLYMPYAGYDTTDRIPAIGILSSTDGETWEPISDEPIHTATPGTWDERGVVPTNIVETEDGLELFFLGFEEPPKVGFQQNSIPLGRLVSTDGGATWVADQDGRPVADTEERGWPGVSVVYADGEYRLYLGDDLGGAGISLITGTIPRGIG